MKVYYSCFVDVHPKFQYQCWIWIHSLLKLAKIAPECIWVHYRKGVDELFLEKIASFRINTKELDCMHEQKELTKITQLANKRFEEADVIVLMDTDMIMTTSIHDKIDCHFISGKVVDFPNPKISILDELFIQAELSNSLGVIKADFSQEITYKGYLNRGLYIIPKKFISTIFKGWNKWALWLVENKALLKKDHNFLFEQVSFCLTIHENNLPVNHLSSIYNYPLDHHSSKIGSPIIIRYHKTLDQPKLLPIPPNANQSYKNCLKKVNEMIGGSI
ncbi:hypothetical protein LC087_04250 [Bacillus carboniphilus]|uniref:Nucleotide-diphospho-sugar transferase domain-containing protein n=1 Tax=Bacillus carboniphilus TaxID=86663 RepID=A0ABY9JXZ6_9BACI|nr:hypothetical protein [Bacillus carboniphilus]WLR43397.1 hypothetical protein LC087_04250 [Bacillus carboniphilus]